MISGHGSECNNGKAQAFGNRTLNSSAGKVTSGQFGMGMSNARARTGAGRGGREVVEVALGGGCGCGDYQPILHDCFVSLLDFLDFLR